MDLPVIGSEIFVRGRARGGGSSKEKIQDGSIQIRRFVAREWRFYFLV